MVLGIIALGSIPWKRVEATESYNGAELRNAIEEILRNNCLDRDTTGIKIVSMDRKETIFEKNSDLPLIPASNLKILTTSAALSTLGPDYRFRTAVFHDGSRDSGTVKGNLYLKGFGDPKLVEEELWKTAIGVKNSGIRRVEGDLVADESFFDDKRYISGWGDAKREQIYSAKLGALSLNFNVISIHVRPGQNVGDPPVVVLDPDTAYVSVQNKGVTVKGFRRRYGAPDFRITLIQGGDTDRVLVSGQFLIDSPPQQFFRMISNPPMYTATVFKEYLEREGVTITGGIRMGQTGAEAGLVYEHLSEPLFRVVADLNKFSNNFMAEQVLKTMGAEVHGNPGTDQKGIEVLENFLSQFGIPKSDFSLVDGSGLSSKNRLTASQLVTVLSAMGENFQYQPEFISSLAIMGVDGSARKRMRNTEDGWMVRVKTGTLNRSSCLSGYLETRQGEMVAFSFLMNNPCSHSQAHKVQDQLVSAVIRYSRTP